eukprot:jgi/Mesvir1/3852/Mv19817-RA.1
MADSHILVFEDFPEDTLHLLLFKNVTNAGSIKARILDGSLEYEAAYFNAAQVHDIFHVHLSAYKALSAHKAGKLSSRSLASELLFNSSGSKHIAESLRRMGIGDGCQSVLVGVFNATPEALTSVRSVVEGEEVGLDQFPALSQTDQIVKFFKIGVDELKASSISNAIATRIAIRDA